MDKKTFNFGKNRYAMVVAVALTVVIGLANGKVAIGQGGGDSAYSTISGVVASDPEVQAILDRHPTIRVQGDEAQIVYTGSMAQIASSFHTTGSGQNANFNLSASQYQALAAQESTISRELRLTAAQMVVRAEDLEDCDASGMEEDICEMHRQNLAASSIALSEEAAKHERAVVNAQNMAREAMKRELALKSGAGAKNQSKHKPGGGCEDGLSGPARGFLWKPVSDSDGNLAILTPSNMPEGDLTIKDFNGNIIAKGKYQCHTNGYRATYRFSKPGGAFKGPVVVEVNDKRWTISNTAARVE